MSKQATQDANVTCLICECHPHCLVNLKHWKSNVNDNWQKTSWFIITRIQSTHKIITMNQMKKLISIHYQTCINIVMIILVNIVWIFHLFEETKHKNTINDIAGNVKCNPCAVQKIIMIFVLLIWANVFVLNVCN